MSKKTIEELVGLAQAADAQAFDEIYKRFKKMALAYSYSLLGDLDLAEDARQEAFLQAYCDLVALRNPAAFPLWFKRIIQGHCLALRKGRRVLTIPLENIAEHPAVENRAGEQIDTERQLKSIKDALRFLPRNERQAIQLFYLEGHTMREAGAIAGAPEKTIKSRLHDGRRKLREKLMRDVKETAWKNHLQGDSRMIKSASKKALSDFDRDIRRIRKNVKGQLEESCNLLCAKGRLLRFLGKVDDALATFDEGLVLPIAAENINLKARFLAERGVVHVQCGRYENAQEDLKSALSLIKKKPEQNLLRAAIHSGLGACAWSQGKLRAAEKLYLRMLGVSQKIKCTEYEVEALSNLAVLEWKKGQLENALANFRVCRRRWKKLNNRLGTAITIMNIGILEESMERFTPARKHYLEALKISEQASFKQVEMASLGNLSSLLLNQNRFANARARAEQAIELAREIQDRKSEAIALENLGLAQLGLKNYPSAKRALEKGTALANKISDQGSILSLELAAIELLLVQNSSDFKELNSRLIATQKTIAASGFESELPRLFRLRLLLAILQKKSGQVKQLLTQGRKICKQQQNKVEENKLLLLEDEWEVSAS